MTRVLEKADEIEEMIQCKALLEKLLISMPKITKIEFTELSAFSDSIHKNVRELVVDFLYEQQRYMENNWL